MVVERVDCVVVGAGVVGLAVARLLARLGREVLVLEREAQIGTGVSSRSSEVIHAGLYYPRDSLKGRLCVEGSRHLYRFCAASGVAHRRCGKIVVAASPTQCGALAAVCASAVAAGAGKLLWLTAADVAALEPQVSAAAALLSPNTGIVDSHGLMLALQGDAEAHGAIVATSTPVAGVAAAGHPFITITATDGGISGGGGGRGGEFKASDPSRVLVATADGTALDCALLVNCAGLAAPRLAAVTAGLSPRFVPQQHFAKGCYYRLMGVSPPPFRRLVYPLPEPDMAGLGVHATLDLAGQVRFGPNIRWVSSPEDLNMDGDGNGGGGGSGGDHTDNSGGGHAADFYAAVRRYWPALPDGALVPDYAGIRPKLSGPGEPTRDFLVQGPRDHGAAGLVNLFGIESPGLTACMALARHVCFIAGHVPDDVAAADDDSGGDGDGDGR